MVRLQEETQAGMYDLILHVGDFAYDLDTVCLDVPQCDALLTISAYVVEGERMMNYVFCLKFYFF